jgi:predicted metal-binding protein
MSDPRHITLVAHAFEYGVSSAVILDAQDIVVEDQLAERCREPRCENYGLSKNCPPHVEGPAGFRSFVKNYRNALLFRIEVPADILYSSGQLEVFQMLHETASGLERAAQSLGFETARGFAGSSCKQVLCGSHHHCAALVENGNCRNPDKARPSMSGYGINVSKLLESAGWTPDIGKREPESSVAGVYGLVLID